MFAGIDNYFILENMFGKADVFAGAELNMLNIFWKDDIVRLEIKTFQKVLNRPKRWDIRKESCDNSFIYITLQGISSFESNMVSINNGLLKIISGGIKADNNKNQIELFFEQGWFFKCVYMVGRIQNTSNIQREEPERKVF
ncbi:hypothetical protein [Pseudoflavonifractor phocaeensis]|uniref:hypothetical protein n=1 Tax=Pseudoflavonifractor phocaeensis TaxID=1870988 RepID=UPI00195DA4A4|nr:hypothetical protein [Pseudoflavonifractor phocaeensis]MBM6888332.1 hypothetical protein [Pseudoflavonifractor phocaeensis]